MCACSGDCCINPDVSYFPAHHSSVGCDRLSVLAKKSSINSPRNTLVLVCNKFFAKMTCQRAVKLKLLYSEPGAQIEANKLGRMCPTFVSDTTQQLRCWCVPLVCFLVFLAANINHFSRILSEFSLPIIRTTTQRSADCTAFLLRYFHARVDDLPCFKTTIMIRPAVATGWCHH